MSGYAFHPEAFTDIDQLWEYIAEHNIDAADRVVADIFAALRTLVASPNIGHRRPDLTARPLRFHLVRDSLIAYAPDESNRTPKEDAANDRNMPCTADRVRLLQIAAIDATSSSTA